VSITTAYHCRKARHTCRGVHSAAAVLAIFKEDKKMFSLRVNFRGKVLIMETAEMCGITVSAVLRTVALWVKNGRVTFADADKKTVALKDRNGNVINYEISAIYHEDVSEFLTADIKLPEQCVSQKDFRSMVIAACLDTQKKARPEWERKKSFDAMLKKCQHLPSVQRCLALLGH
jgi:hypothetical protein